MSTPRPDPAATDAEIANLARAVAAQGTVIDGVVTLLNGLSSQLNQFADDPAAIRAIADSVDAKAAELANAVASVP